MSFEEGWRSGDLEAIAAVLRRHEPALVRTVQRMVGRRSIAEEIVQETFVRTLERAHRIELDKARSWLFGVALNLARKHVKRGDRAEMGSLASDRAAASVPSEASDPEALTLAGEELRRLERALQQLPPKQREVVLLRHVEGLSFAEIARAVRTPVSVLKVRSSRARARLLELCAQEPS